MVLSPRGRAELPIPPRQTEGSGPVRTFASLPVSPSTAEPGRFHQCNRVCRAVGEMPQQITAHSHIGIGKGPFHTAKFAGDSVE
jgi:hypothetical protein